MKKKVFFILIISIIQNTEIVKLKDYFSGEGVIFNKNVKYPFVETDYLSSYTPKIEDIVKAENFLMNNYYEYETNVLDSFKLDKIKINVKYKNPRLVRKKFYKYNRQYIGFINKSNDTIIHVILLNFSNKNKANENFSGWRENIVFGFGEFYEMNQKNYRFNLSKKKFEYRVR